MNVFDKVYLALEARHGTPHLCWRLRCDAVLDENDLGELWWHLHHELGDDGMLMAVRNAERDSLSGLVVALLKAVNEVAERAGHGTLIRGVTWTTDHPHMGTTTKEGT